MPFMDEPPGAKISSAAIGVYGKAITALRRVTMETMDDEPSWRARTRRLETGYEPNW
jgi:hydrogenase small subunit